LWGHERAGRLRDPFGQQWMLSGRIESVPAEEMARRAAAFFDHPIDFVSSRPRLTPAVGRTRRAARL
jgi:hypothetical protein